MKRRTSFMCFFALLLIMSIMASIQGAVFAKAPDEGIICMDDDVVSSNSVEQYNAQASSDGTTNICIKVQYGQTEARKMTSMVNEFRQGDEAWAWDSTDTEKVYYSDLGTLTYDYKLEQLAMKRAAEIAFRFAHKHPDGSNIHPVPGGNYYAWGENICAGSNLDSAEAAFTLWREDNCNHAGQGHRINMLGSWATGIGIGHVTLNGYHYWVMELGSPNSGMEATAADDGTEFVDFDISNDDITNVSVLPTQQSYTISGTDGMDVPDVKVTLKMAQSAFPSRGVPIVSQPVWTSQDEAIAKITDGRIYGIKAGSTSITTTVWGEEITVSVNVEGQSADIPEGTPANPIHHCTKETDESGDTDTTTWSYVYFGSYPQSEVTDSTTIAAIDNTIATSGIAADAGVDVWVNGTKYRRIGKDDTNHSGYFDDIPTSNGYRYFKWERIKWRVLQNDGNTLFVVADRAIDCKDYNEEYKNITWETSTIRDWLNTGFYNTAFSNNEQSAIVIQNVVNEDNPSYGTEGGNDTSDKVYLLSISEVTDETYGFCSNINSVSRGMKTSDYANARGTYRNDSKGNCWWWLRSPGGTSHYAANVYSDGWVRRNGGDVHNDYGGACPALHISLSSDVWSTTDDGTSGEGGNGGVDSKEETLKSLQAFKAKTEYMQGEALSLDDLTVTAVYENSTKPLSADSYTVNKAGVDMDTPGSYALEISYTEKSVTRKTAITITVKKNGGNTQQPDKDLEGGSPANPVHHCTKQNDGTDYTDFSYVYFGSYPQSEVTDSATIAAIDNAIATSGIVADAGVDVWVNGTKYRRISKDDTNYSGCFDDMPTSNGYRYFKWERIKWRVLQNDGNTLFVVADRAIDCKDYNEEWVDITWENSTIRDWLNTSFYNTAFSGSEQNAIVTQNVANEDNPFYGTEGGNGTSDKVYLLSISEVTDEEYGFCSNGNTHSVSRRMKASDYTNARGTRRSNSSGYEGNCDWWLRSPGNYIKYAAYATYDGYVYWYGIHYSDGVCPALHINLSSDIWSTTDDGTSGEGGNGGADSKEEILKSLQASKVKTEYIQGEVLNLNDLTVTAVYENSTKPLSAGSYTVNKAGVDMDAPGSYTLEISYTEKSVTKRATIVITVKEKTSDNTQQPSDNDQNQPVQSANIPEGTPTNPIHHCNTEDGTKDTTTWSYVYFGSYPQSEVTDRAAIAAIDNAIATSGIEADVGVDVWVNGTKYRRIGKDDTNHSGYFDDMPTSNGYRYFKWERIKWRVLQNDGDTLFVVADKAIDCKDYDEEYKSITWENSTIRDWLNTIFYNTAFSNNEQSAIVTQNVVNEDNPEYGTEGGNNTSDKVYLLSISEVTNDTYGFCSDYSTLSMSRRMKASDYANARGTWRSDISDYKGNCWWWLRSSGITSYRAAFVGSDGWGRRSGYYVYTSDDGVCPALHINLSSDIWFTTDDGTSGEGGNGGADSKGEILKGLQVSKVKIEYIQGEALNLDDLTVTAVYENSSRVLPAGSYTTNVKTINISTPGRKILTISYTEGTITKTADIAIIITQKVDTVTQKADTEPQVKKGAKITDKASEGTYKVTNTDSATPTVEYTGTTNKNKKTITIPEYITYQGVKYKVTSMSAKCFKGNKKLTTIKIASSILKIGDSAFEGSTSLKTVTIGKGLKTIGKNAFKNCKKLKTLTIKSSKLKTVGKNAFKGIYTKCKIKVPAKKVKAYQKLMKKKGQAVTVKVVK